MGEVVRMESANALIKQIKAIIERVDKAETDMDYWKHKAGVQLKKLRDKSEHGEWLPYLKTIGISQQRASELMNIGHNIDWAKYERERKKQSERRRRKTKAKSPPHGGTFEIEQLPDGSPEQRWQFSLANLAGDILARPAYWTKHFPDWQTFSVPSHIKTLVKEAAAEFASLAEQIAER
jgi:hypothetical protein